MKWDSPAHSIFFATTHTWFSSSKSSNKMAALESVPATRTFCPFEKLSTMVGVDLPDSGAAESTKDPVPSHQETQSQALSLASKLLGKLSHHLEGAS